MLRVSAQRLVRTPLQVGARQEGLAGRRREVRRLASGPAEGEEEALRVGLRFRDAPAQRDHARPEQEILLVLFLDLRLRQVLLRRLLRLQGLEDVALRGTRGQSLDVRRVVRARARVTGIRCADERHPLSGQARLERGDGGEQRRDGIGLGQRDRRTRGLRVGARPAGRDLRARQLARSDLVGAGGARAPATRRRQSHDRHDGHERLLPPDGSHRDPPDLRHDPPRSVTSDRIRGPESR